MLEQATETAPPVPTSSRKRLARIRFAAIAAVIVVASLTVPAIPFFVGVFLVVAVALHAWSPVLRPFVDPIVRVPVARAAERRARLLRVAGVGGLLLVTGSVGAGVHARLHSGWEQRDRLHGIAEKQLSEILERARSHLANNDPAEAELVLLNADAVVDATPGMRKAVDDLLERIHRSGDSKAILDILIELPQREFDAFASGESVPPALDFGERVLTLKAVEVGHEQLEQARQARAHR